MPRETFLADATDIVRYNAPGPTAQDWWWSVVSSTRCTGADVRDVLWRRREYEYANLFLKEVDNAHDRRSPRTWHGWMDLHEDLPGK
jgi:hypothetical protein